MSIQRAHNRKSVKPLLAKRGWWRRDEEPGIGLFVINAGFGPAKIISLKANLDGVKIEEHVSDIVKKACIESGVRKGLVSHTRIGKRSVIQAGEQLPIIVIYPSKKPSKQDVEALRSFLGRIVYVIEYESLYGEKQHLTVKDRPPAI